MCADARAKWAMTTRSFTSLICVIAQVVTFGLAASQRVVVGSAVDCGPGRRDLGRPAHRLLAKGIRPDHVARHHADRRDCGAFDPSRRKGLGTNHPHRHHSDDFGGCLASASMCHDRRTDNAAIPTAAAPSTGGFPTCSAWCGARFRADDVDAAAASVARARRARGPRGQAASEERRRIAREIHDVVAHSLSITLLNLTVARHALQQDRDIDDAIEALQDAERVGLQAMSDVRLTVGLLGAGPSSPTPEPGITTSPLSSKTSGAREWRSATKSMDRLNSFRQQPDSVFTASLKSRSLMLPNMLLEPKPKCAWASRTSGRACASPTRHRIRCLCPAADPACRVCVSVPNCWAARCVPDRRRQDGWFRRKCPRAAGICRRDCPRDHRPPR